MNESVKRMILDLNKYGKERKGDLSILVLQAADMIEELADRVDALESGIPAEESTGHWMQDGLHRRYTWMCSRCHEHYRAMYDYCPSCGTKMESEEQA